MHYTTDKRLVICNHSPIIVEPRFIIFQDDGPYLVVTGGIYPVMHYRLDKVANLRLIGESSSECHLTIDATEYAQRKFVMFSDDNLYVTFQYRRRILDYMIELFGTGIHIIRIDDETLESTVNINRTGALLLAHQYLDVMRIAYPEDLKETMIDSFEKATKWYRQ